MPPLDQYKCSEQRVLAGNVKMSLEKCRALWEIFGDPDEEFVEGIYGGALPGLCSYSTVTNTVFFVDTMTDGWMTSNHCLWAAPNLVSCLCDNLVPPATPPLPTPLSPPSPPSASPQPHPPPPSPPSPPLPPSTPDDEAAVIFARPFWWVTLGGVGIGLCCLCICCFRWVWLGEARYRPLSQEERRRQVVKLPGKLPVV